MDDNDITVITADFMYLVIIGDSNKIINIATLLNINNTNKKYIDIRIDTPCAEINEKIIKKYFSNNKCITFSEGVEQAQTLTYAEGYDKYYKMLVELENSSTKINIKFPKISLNDIDDEALPEKLISNWIKKNKLNNIMTNLIIRPVNIVGYDNDILVFAARVE